ncbi:hypothetical protein LOTGIDRAFT_152624 [Lottia gigantea]|uniref:FDX-ACB domain-containing protein n=1 Tax=Lottia gigantea TaxID=225164 RepID=V4AKA4_LOTGI|nr:hypothetical protein LOTGIDRAFT_152624 [Lottia gigantea]ESO97532.1 hypothetical protein LOTGIDRAFT_152624 [Lottia gigantea]
MDRQTKGFVLVVGDGDFSLSVSFSERRNLTCDQFVSTSLETEETILKHKLAVDNIRFLKSKGVKVYFEVDARELHSDSLFEDRKFSRIIFNFPHSGGKSNHKRNRALLNDFFSSASQILEDDGQIMVTLCRGQGGTPADKPRREWHDSWQIVSMATNSNLTLREVIPFDVNDYTSYNSTGFRSQDKGFNTEGAITHVFELSDQVPVPAMVNNYTIKIEEQHYTCPPYLQHKLNRNLVEDKSHPIALVLNSFVEEFKKKVDIPVEKLELPWYICVVSADTSKSYLLQQVPAQTEEKEIDTQESDGIDENKDFESEKLFDQNFNNANGHISNGHSNDQLKIRTSLMEQLGDLSSLSVCESKCYYSAGITARPCLINLNSIPVQHEFLVVCPIVSSISFDSFSQNVLETLGTLSTLDLEICDTANQCAEVIMKGKVTPVKIGSILLSNDCYTLLLYLDKLTQIVFGIDQIRLLWSKDQRFSTQFEDVSKWPIEFKPFYLYPMKFVHDLSLWEKESEEFDELRMCNIIRNITGDCVENVTLLDRFQDLTTSKWSRCYRFTYISHDQALSYITSWKLQSLLRLQLAKTLGITLR